MSAAEFVPESRSLDSLREAAAGCRGCDLWEPATQTVFGEGSARASVITNAVKHFRFTRRGKRRLHEKPSAQQVRACRPWLEAEVETVKPRLLVLLGATAAQALMGPTFRVTQRRGSVMPTPIGVPAIATVHPSSILRAPDDAAREEAMRAFVHDLRAVRLHLGLPAD